MIPEKGGLYCRCFHASEWLENHTVAKSNLFSCVVCNLRDTDHMILVQPAASSHCCVLG